MVKGLGRIRLGALVLLGSIFSAFLIVAHVSAGGTATLSVGSDEIAPGETTTVEVTTDVGGTGLGAWTVDVFVEDPDQVSIVDCEAESHSVCNPDYTPTTVRFAGASATALTGEISLGTVTVRCADSEGSSVLSLDTVGFADATVGGPVEIPVTFSPGTIDCVEGSTAHPTATHGPGGGGATPTATVGASALPPTGYGSSDGGTPLALIIAFGVVGMVGLAASTIAIKRTRA